ncbi:hypothetical protein CH53_2938 [Yersinia intermedia]|nr:hypothetical protein CH53_2938 [Yersinia intermedia]
MALTDVKVRSAKPTDKPYKLTDGEGMHLMVHPNGSKYWRLQYRFDGTEAIKSLSNVSGREADILVQNMSLNYSEVIFDQRYSQLNKQEVKKYEQAIM